MLNANPSHLSSKVYTKTHNPRKTYQKIAKPTKKLAKKQKNGIFIIEHKFLTVATA
jgi:hypothetical protein